jgi:Type II secretion system (T2SS), protein E, N-terminal domain
VDCNYAACAMQSRWRRLFHKRTDGIAVQGRWYCSAGCFEDATAQTLAQMMRVPDEPFKRLHRIPLGLVLLGRGVITNEQLKSALTAQRDAGSDKLGRWLVRLGVASPRDVSLALASQWGCSVFPLDRDRRYRECSHMLPLAILESYRMLPVHFLSDTNLLFLAFSEEIDHTAIYATEQLLGSRTQPCVVSEVEMESAFDELRTVARPGEVVFETLWDPSEMAHAVRNYATELDAREISIARPRGFVWARLKNVHSRWDMVFRMPSHSLPHAAAMSASAGEATLA